MTRYLAVLALFLATQAMAHDKPHPKQPEIKPEPITDTWGGVDKRDHFVISTAMGAWSRTFLSAQPVTAGGLCMIPGTLKEAYDARRGGPGNWSWKDMTANLAGCVLGVYGADVMLTKDGNRYTLGYNWRF